MRFQFRHHFIFWSVQQITDPPQLQCSSPSLGSLPLRPLSAVIAHTHHGPGGVGTPLEVNNFLMDRDVTTTEQTHQQHSVDDVMILGDQRWTAWVSQMLQPCCLMIDSEMMQHNNPNCISLLCTVTNASSIISCSQCFLDMSLPRLLHGLHFTKQTDTTILSYETNSPQLYGPHV